ncbi:hypothetical protein GF327_02805 [Candidatus Woesearchaeota archaeon]|nr:hypothetical protein [Candidatus Woesearchaeota archaeon]
MKIFLRKNMNIKINKKSDLTIYFIIGLVIILSMAIMLYLNNTYKKQIITNNENNIQNLNLKKQIVEYYVNGCIEKEFFDAKDFCGLEKVVCIETWIKNNLKNCINKFGRNNPGLIINVGSSGIETINEKDSISIKIDMPIEIFLSDKRAELSEFNYVFIKTKFKNIGNLVSEEGILNEDVSLYSSDKFFNIKLQKGTKIIFSEDENIDNVKISVGVEQKNDEEKNIVGLYIYNLKPDGLQFEGNCKIKIYYDEKKVDEEKNELVLMMREDESEIWKKIEEYSWNKQQNYISAKLKHFSQASIHKQNTIAREPYTRTYVLLPQNAQLSDINYVIDNFWQSKKWTIGASADDAGLGGNEVTRQVIAVAPGSWPTDLKTFFQDYYNGLYYSGVSNVNSIPASPVYERLGEGSGSYTPRDGGNYDRIYVLLPQTTPAYQVKDIVNIGGWEKRKFTIGGSAGDAGIGNLLSRNVIAVDPKNIGTGINKAWFDTNYAGVNYCSVTYSGNSNFESDFNNAYISIEQGRACPQLQEEPTPTPQPVQNCGIGGFGGECAHECNSDQENKGQLDCQDDPASPQIETCCVDNLPITPEPTEDIIDNVPYISQLEANCNPNKLCGYTCVTMVSSFFGKTNADITTVQDLAEEDYGSRCPSSAPNLDNYVAAAKIIKGLDAVWDWNTYQQVKGYINSGIPIQVALNYGELNNYRCLKDYSGGHSVVVVGYSEPDNNWIIHDPYCRDGGAYRSIPNTEFVNAVSKIWEEFKGPEGSEVAALIIWEK